MNWTEIIFVLWYDAAWTLTFVIFSVFIDKLLLFIILIIQLSDIIKNSLPIMLILTIYYFAF